MTARDIAMGTSAKYWWIIALALLMMVAGCSTKPTPYQEINKGFGYDETRLQPDVYRISFRGSRKTRESNMLACELPSTLRTTIPRSSICCC